MNNGELSRSLQTKKASILNNISADKRWKLRISSWQRAQLRRWAEIALAVEPIRNGGCSLGPILVLLTHTTILRNWTTQEPGAGGRHWWAREASLRVGRSSTNGKFPPFSRDNDGSSYARVRRIGEREKQWEKIVTLAANGSRVISLRDEHSTNN